MRKIAFAAAVAGALLAAGAATAQTVPDGPAPHGDPRFPTDPTVPQQPPGTSGPGTPAPAPAPAPKKPG